nr:histone-lysine N-methyltransferase SETMAR-like [Bactrocera oleae]
MPWASQTNGLFDQLDRKIREKRSGLQHKINNFQQENAPAPKGVITMTKFNKLKYELLEHPPYSPVLALSGYYLFRNLKQFFRGGVFR